MSETADLWQLHVPALHLAQAEAAAAALEELALAVTMIESGDPAESVATGALWDLEVLCDGRPAAAALRRCFGGILPAHHLAPLSHLPWVVESQKGQPAVSAGRFHIHGAHLPRHPSPGAIDLTIEAGLAFGSGQHETTRGCLLAIAGLAKRGSRRNVLDLGTGSGVLALAAAKIWHRRVLAADIDAVATGIARENFVRHSAPHLRAVTAAGFRHRAIASAAPFDLILANILARPLCRMAPALARHLAPGGIVVLSGLLDAQENAVLAAYRAQGLTLKRPLVLGRWHTLLLDRHAGPPRR